MLRKFNPNNRKQLSFVGILIEVTAVAVLLILAGYLMKNSGSRLKVPDAKESTEEVSLFQYTDRIKEVGELHTTQQEGPNYLYGIQYPVVGNETIDRNIDSKIKEMIDLFSLEEADYQAEAPEERAVLTVEYESYAVGDKMASIVFYLSKNDKAKDVSSQSVKTYSYDLDTGSILGLQDIFITEFENQVSNAVTNYFSADETLKPYRDTVLFMNNISPLPGNFSSFSLSGEHVVFYFSSGVLCPVELGVQKALIPKSELESVLLIDSSGNIKGTEAETEETGPVTSEEVSEETTQAPATAPTPLASPETEPPITLEAATPSVELDLNRPMIAFTFDDGPYAPVTGRILDVLEAHDSKATFFVVGNRVNNYKGIIERAYELGCQIGNHSYNHKSFENIPGEDVLWQITYTNDLLETIMGDRAAVVRVPYGAYKGQVSSVVKYPMIQWNVDTLDWKTKNKNAIVAEVQRTVKDGAVILMHDLYPTTAEAFEELVPLLIAEGYQLVTVHDLFAAKGIPLEPGRVYFNTN